jgi:hypothetical protein
VDLPDDFNNPLEHLKANPAEPHPSLATWDVTSGTPHGKHPFSPPERAPALFEPFHGTWKDRHDPPRPRPASSSSG